MDKIDFANLVAFIVKLTGHTFDTYEIKQIDDLTSKQSPAPSAANVRMLLEFIANGRKIDAIREFRSLTGDGLKESKDAVERLMHRLIPPSPITDAAE